MKNPQLPLDNELANKLIKNFTLEEMEILSKGFRIPNDLDHWDARIKSQSLETTAIEPHDTLLEVGGDEEYLYLCPENKEYIVPICFPSLSEAKSFIMHVTGKF